MGFSVAAAAAIIFAGSIVSFAVVVQALQGAAEDLGQARARDDARRLELAQTRIGLINGTANGTSVELNLTNSGSVTLHVRTLEALVNGTLYTANITLREVEGRNATNLWAPGQTLHLVVDAPVAAPAALKLVTDNGYEFYAGVS
jgi:archaellum component FlaF (FlaF/FlaG flagellin family)